MLSCFSRVRLFVTQWTVAHQAPLSMEYSRQERWSGLSCPFPGYLPDPGVKPRSPALQVDCLSSEPPGKPTQTSKYVEIGLPWCLSGNKSACQCRRRGFDHWVRKIPWKRKWQSTSVFLSGKSYEQRSLKGYSPWGQKSQTRLIDCTIAICENTP